MMDFFADNTVRRCIVEIINNKDKIPSNEALWYQTTKCIIREKGVSFVIKNVQLIIEEISDENWFENKYPPEIFKEKKEIRRYNTNNKLRDFINTKIKISDIARSYGLSIDRKGRTLCPFHYDSDPSLIFNDKKNVFHCFGCHIKGDLITFIKKMEEMKSGDQERS